MSRKIISTPNVAAGSSQPRVDKFLETNYELSRALLKMCVIFCLCRVRPSRLVILVVWNT